MTTEEFRTMALSLPGCIESPHFEKTAFRVMNKKIFATIHEESNMAHLKLLQSDQFVYCSFNKKEIYPVPNKWGLQGWTTFELKKIPKELMLDALENAYKEALKSKSKKKA